MCAGPSPRSRSPWPTQTWDCLARARLLPAQVEIALADGDVETARSAAAELCEIATRYARPALAAAAECAQATVLLAEGDPAMAAASLRRGIALWREAGAPYETARARLLPGGSAGAARRSQARAGGVRRRPGSHSSHWERRSISNVRHGSSPRLFAWMLR